jgi:hypothetical protein
MTIEIPIICQGNRVLTEIGVAGMSINTVNARVEMVGICGKLGDGNVCVISGENCILKHRKFNYNDGLGIGDGDEEVID